MGANGKIIQFGMVIPVLIAVVLHAAEAHEVAISWWWGGLLWALAFIGFYQGLKQGLPKRRSWRVRRKSTRDP